MKKFTLWALSAAFAWSMVSCDMTGKKVNNDDEDSKDEEVKITYDAPAYDIDDVIDPNDAEAYAKYASDDDYAVEAIDDYDGPSDVDILDIDFDESYQIDIILDEMDENILSMRKLIRATNRDDDAIYRVADRIVAISDKVADNEDLCTEEQADRFAAQAAQFKELANIYKSTK